MERNDRGRTLQVFCLRLQNLANLQLADTLSNYPIFIPTRDCPPHPEPKILFRIPTVQKKIWRAQIFSKQLLQKKIWRAQIFLSCLRIPKFVKFGYFPEARYIKCCTFSKNSQNGFFNNRKT